MWKKVFRKKKKWTKAEEKKLLQLLDSLIEELDDEPDAEDEDEDEDEEEIVPEAKECSCSINELMKTGCQCGGV